MSGVSCQVPFPCCGVSFQWRCFQSHRNFQIRFQQLCLHPSSYYIISPGCDAAAITSLTFGIYKKSRFAAIIMFVYFAASKLMMLQDISVSGTFVIPALILGYYFFQGIRGTLTSHKIKVVQNNRIKT